MTDMQALWLAEYLNPKTANFNATEAARLAGYRWPNKVGPRLRQELAAEIEAFLAERLMSASEALDRLSQQARADIGEFASLQTSDDLTNHPKSYLIKKMKRHARRNKDGTLTARIEVELYDAQAALQLIGKHHGLFTDRVEHSGHIDVIGIEVVRPDDNDSSTD